jgi:hypothetical protein
MTVVVAWLFCQDAREVSIMSDQERSEIDRLREELAAKEAHLTWVQANGLDYHQAYEEVQDAQRRLQDALERAGVHTQ